MSKNIPIYFYIITSVIAIIAMIIDNEWLMLLSKPSIIPALGIYYFSSDKKYMSPTLIAILIIYFISDALTLLQISNFTKYMMLIDFIPYILLGKIVMEDALQLQYKRNEFLIALFGFVSIMVTMFFLIDSLSEAFMSYCNLIFIYGIVLSIYVSSSLYLFLLEHSDFSIYILLASIFALSADILYVVTNMIFYVKALNYIEFVLQVISCFYVVSYFLKREKTGSVNI